MSLLLAVSIPLPSSVISCNPTGASDRPAAPSLTASSEEFPLIHSTVRVTSVSASAMMSNQRHRFRNAIRLVSPSEPYNTLVIHRAGIFDPSKLSPLKNL